MEKRIEKTIEYIKKFFEEEYSGHDYFHSIRVFNTALTIAEEEKADKETVALAALLHDVDDRKLSPETAEHKDHAVAWLRNNGVEEKKISDIVRIIDEVSFNGKDSVVPSTIEGKCVQDADRLDAIGAIGIARAFTYGGAHQRVLYDPEVKPLLNMSKEEYQKHVSTTVNHFDEKLFLLKDMMSTDYGKKMAEKRHQIMVDYIEQFKKEWNGEA